MRFDKLILTPAGDSDALMAIAACRAGATGIVNFEFDGASEDWHAALDRVARACDGGFGIKLASLDAHDEACIAASARRGLHWVILDARACDAAQVRRLQSAGLKVMAEVLTAPTPSASLDGAVDAVLLKGNESGGLVGEDSSFILLQKWLGRTSLPIYLRGGMTPQVAAACHAVGVAGGVLDSQVLLLEDAHLSEVAQGVLGALSGNETVAVGDGERGNYLRILNRPGHAVAKAFMAEGEGLGWDGLRALANGKINWTDPRTGLLPVGHDVCFAADWKRRYGRLANVLDAFERALQAQFDPVAQPLPVREASPLAQALGTQLPIVQGPMTRVSDVAAFADAVSLGGALPMVAFALLKGQALDELLARTAKLLGDRPWGIGLLGFAPQSLLDEQLAIATRHKPSYAIIAGGRPDQAVTLEAAGVPTFLHVPSANLIPLFIQEGARRFIFEGRECGGHVGPLSSFVLWSTMIDRLQDEIDARKVAPEELQLLFAGGIHDAVSSAMLQVMAAPLAARGVKIGILMGSAYLFTREIVDTGAIVPRFQREVIECERTVNLESGPGHASRCAYTPFARDFFGKRKELRAAGTPGDESRRILDDLIMGRLRVASKGSARRGDGGPLVALDEAEQHAQGMYMLGQVATLRSQVTTIAELHRAVSEDAAALIAARHAQSMKEAQPATAAQRPADIAIIGVAGLLPKANSAQEFWENILDKVDAITEIPSHRWDWRLYFDADRNAKDKIYSKWGGFLDDLAFDPTRYGMPPKSIASVDTMQLMALEVARWTLADAGYDSRPFDRERASVIVGASGGTGDVGSQYGLRSELPRFSGELPDGVASRLPEWTEDTFAGILLNVIAGRIANRLNFGGVNFTTDAACGSSLAAVYQAVTELVAGRSDLVIAGGVDTVQGPFGYLCFSKTQALSPRGRCSTFDAQADGIVISEGIAMVALKRLADAERDGDRIYAVIKGVGGSSDGNAKGLTAPLPAGQLRAMRRAYTMAGFGPSSVDLFEAHGTGTVAGDTAELESTTRLIREEGGRRHGAAVGSVKTMIGHTKATAGVAGLVKAVLALHHRVLPPHLNLKTPNRVLQQEDVPLYVLDQATPWLTTEGQPRRAAVSAFGFGGTNFHTVLEEYGREYRPWLRGAAKQRWPAELLLLCAADRESLAARVRGIAAQLDTAPALALRDIAATLARSWRPESERLAIVARDLEDLRAKLEHASRMLEGQAKAPAGVHHASGATLEGQIAVLFPGQGSQYTGMGREVGLHFPVVAETIAQADAVLGASFADCTGGRTLGEMIFPRAAYDDAARSAAQQALTSTDVAQPALGAVSAGLYRLMQSLGLEPDMLGGHSYGEFVALHAAGAIDFAALMTLSAARGRFIVDAAKASGAELGTMAAVPAQRKDVEEAIADIDQVIIANHNAPQQCILSGPHAAVRAATAKLATMGIQAQEIPVAAAFHSSLVKPAQQALSEMIEATPWQSARVPVYSNSTARAHPADVARSKRLMAEHLVQPVEFVEQVRAMHADGARIFVEVGPKPVLSRLVPKILEGRPHVAVAIDDGSGLTGLLAALGQLLCAGVPLDTAPLFAQRDCRVGDVDRLAELDRTEPVPKTAWWINGSGARRNGEAVRQIGVTLEQAQQHRAESSSPDPNSATQWPDQPPAVTPVTAPVAASPARAAPTRTDHFPARGRPMDDRRHPPATGDAAVMAAYFETMRQFLETQERVMTAYMGQPAASAWRPGMRPQRSPVLPLPQAAEVLTAAPARAPMVAASAPAPAPRVESPAATPAAAAAAPASATAASAAPAPANKAAPATAASVSREKMTEMILAIIEDKTGYPKDMVGLDQNLEADLGIDSIKRIEVVGAMLQALPEPYRVALTESRSKLNTQPTLNGMLELLTSAKVGGEVGVPFDLAGTGARVAQGDHPSRHVVQAVAEPIPENAARRLEIGSFVVAGDGHGVGAALTRRLQERGCSVERIDTALLRDEAALSTWCGARSGSLAGVVHLGALDAEALDLGADLGRWRAQLTGNEKSSLLLLRDFSARLGPGSHALVATGLGGLFGRGAATSAGGLTLQGGGVGMLKSLHEERPELRTKAVDVDPGQGAEAIAQSLLQELELDGGRIEVGYPGGERTVFRTVAAPARAADAATAQHALDGIVVLATGGARGITAEALREIARPGNALVLTGRSELPEQEPAELAALATADALRRHFIARVRSGELALTPSQVSRQVQQVLAQREMRANIADFRQAGSSVEYRAIDVTDEAAMASLLGDIHARHGRIDGVVHGAGVIEDKLLAEKSSESWSRVVETKVLGLLLLVRHLRPDALRFLTVFSSVAGRYGNSGQSDYAAANELMNRICCQLQTRWGGRVNVHALCWGPWGPTRHGAGMVTAETEAKFAAKGVTLVDSRLGRELLAAEIARGPDGPVEVVCGKGPWEQHEAEVGRIALAEPPAAAPSRGALIGAARVTSRPTGQQILDLRLDERHLYLQEHAIDGTPVLPAAAALEIVAEAAATLWPGWKVVEVRDFRLMKGVELESAQRDLRVVIEPPPYGSSEGFEVHATLQSELAGGRALAHYRGVVRLEQQLAHGERLPEAHHADRSLTARKAYDEWLFHGPRFQLIDEVRGISEAGASCRVHPSTPGSWLRGAAAQSQAWCFDPGLLDTAAQMVWVWSRWRQDASALPSRFGRVVRYREVLPERLSMAYEALPSADPGLVRANVVFVDEAGDPVLLVEELESIASAALNRLGGTARSAVEA